MFGNVEDARHKLGGGGGDTHTPWMHAKSFYNLSLLSCNASLEGTPQMLTVLYGSICQVLSNLKKT